MVHSYVCGSPPPPSTALPLENAAHPRLAPRVLEDRKLLITLTNPPPRLPLPPTCANDQPDAIGDGVRVSTRSACIFLHAYSYSYAND